LKHIDCPTEAITNIWTVCFNMVKKQGEGFGHCIVAVR
jgi:hypothetical protein